MTTQADARHAGCDHSGTRWNTPAMCPRCPARRLCRPAAPPLPPEPRREPVPPEPGGGDEPAGAAARAAGDQRDWADIPETDRARYRALAAAIRGAHTAPRRAAT